MAAAPVACDTRRVSPLRAVWLAREYVDAATEAALLAAATGPAARWTSVSGRRLQAHGGTVHERAGLLPAPLPKWLLPLLARLQAEAGLFAAAPLNHVLVNAYEAGEGILPHQDGPLYHPAVAIVSLGADAVMQFTPHARLLDGADDGGAGEAPTVRVFLPRRSLLLFAEEAYTDYLHGIAAQPADDLRGEGEAPGTGVCNPPGASDGVPDAAAVPRAGTRVSLTCRSVLKVRRNLLPTRP